MFCFLVTSIHKFYFIPACWTVSRAGGAKILSEYDIHDLHSWGGYTVYAWIFVI
jgi:hypothetical protein